MERGMTSEKSIRWGILGTGNIANAFATGLTFVDDAELIAVGSRRKERAEEFGRRHRVPHRHASYEALANDPDVDVVYVATPHVLHKENSLLCLRAGKAVLCEKPLTINAREAVELIQFAREQRLFLMEAMWTRFIPLVGLLREMLAEGRIGAVHLFVADLGFRMEFDPAHRAFNPALGGGALLDVGVYPLSFASMVLGSPAQVTGMAHIGKTGVDERSAILLEYENGALALLYAAVDTNTPREVLIMGTKGQIRVLPPMHRPEKLILLSRDQEMPAAIPFVGNGYNYEAMEVMNCLQAGKLESEIMPLDESLEIVKTMDAVRAQWGMKYPTE